MLMRTKAIIGKARKVVDLRAVYFRKELSAWLNDRHALEGNCVYLSGGKVRFMGHDLFPPAINDLVA
jgi:hypothetical protein